MARDPETICGILGESRDRIVGIGAHRVEERGDEQSHRSSDRRYCTNTSQRTDLSETRGEDMAPPPKVNNLSQFASIFKLHNSLRFGTTPLG